MVENSEMPFCYLRRQNDDARICAYAEHRTTSRAIFQLFRTFEYIHTAQIMCGHFTSTKDGLQGVYVLLHSKCKKPRASDTISELRSIPGTDTMTSEKQCRVQGWRTHFQTVIARYPHSVEAQCQSQGLPRLARPHTVYIYCSCYCSCHMYCSC